MCSRTVKAIHQRFLDLSDRALEAEIRVKLGKALLVLILRHPSHEFLIRILSIALQAMVMLVSVKK
jgi:hypothetical protein